MGLGDFVKGVGDAVTNVAKGAAWVARPDHWDDIAEGVGKAGEYVVEHPGQVWDTGFEVGRTMLKDQLKPQNLAMTAGLLALTVATGGAAAPALVGEVAEGAAVGAKALSAGTAAVKGLEAAGTVAKGAEAAGTALKGAEAAGTVLKGAEAAGEIAKGAETVGTAVKGAEAAGEVVKGAEAASGAAEGVEAAVNAGTKGSKFMNAVDKGLGLKPGEFGKTASNIMNPLENSRFGMAALRERGAAKLLEAGGEAPGLMRQLGAAALQGGGRGAGMAEQLPGMSDKVYNLQKNYARAEAVVNRVHQAGQAVEGVEAVANPVGYAMSHGGEEKVHDYVNEKAGSGSGYTDLGQTSAGLYGGDEQKAIGSGGQTEAGLYKAPGRQGAFAEGQQMAGLSQPQKAIGTGDQTATGMYAATPPGTPPGGTASPGTASGFPMAALPSGQTAGPNATAGQATSPYDAAPKVDFTGSPGGGPPSSPGTVGATGGRQPYGGPPVTGTSPQGGTYRSGTGQPATPGGQQNTTLKDPGKAPRRVGDWSPKGQHFWEGPRSQWAGGVKANYDWRPVDPLRPIDSSTPGTAKRSSAYQAKKAKWEGDKAAYDRQQEGQGDLNEQGAPESFSPEVPKSGMYAISSGQQPQGALNPGQPTRPEIGAGPAVRMGEARGARHNLTNVGPLQQPIGAIGPGSQKSNVIDADSSSPDDFKFDNSGQGYFDFANTMGTAAVGQQPNTSPMYAPNTSRTSRRAISAA